MKAVSLTLPDSPDAALTAAADLFRARAKEALDAGPPGKITGRVVDTNHRPVAGANVQATLQLTVMMFDQPGRFLHRGLSRTGRAIATLRPGPTADLSSRASARASMS